MSIWGKLIMGAGKALARIMDKADPSQSEAPWMTVAKAELGVAEVPGSEANTRIQAYHRETTLHASSDEVPWCSSFVNWVFKQVGIEGTHSAAARSWQTWGEHLSIPKAGCVAVLSRGGNRALGHVGFFLGYSGKQVVILGGNQGDKVSVQKFPMGKVVAYRWPK